MLTTIQQLAVTFKYIYNKELYLNIYKTLILLHYKSVLHFKIYFDKVLNFPVHLCGQ